jgi:uncharacterized membrane protein HdeD (DUF308 family)
MLTAAPSYGARHGARHGADVASPRATRREGRIMMRSEARNPIRDVTGLWWVPLVTGIAWLIVALLVLRFDTTSIATVGVLMGVVFLAAGVNELVLAYIRRSWAWAHVLLGVLFVVGAILAFVQPYDAFWALASILGLLLVIDGAFNLAAGIASKDENDAWWLGVVVGVLEILLAFWVSQQFFAPRAILILVWVAFAALFRGISQIVYAFHIRRLDKNVASVDRDLSRVA